MCVPFDPIILLLEICPDDKSMDKDKCLWIRIFIKDIFTSLVISSTFMSINSLYTADSQIYISKFNLFLDLWTSISNGPLDISIWVSNGHLRLNMYNLNSSFLILHHKHNPNLALLQPSPFWLMAPLSFSSSSSQKLCDLWLLSSLGPHIQPVNRCYWLFLQNISKASCFSEPLPP